LFLEGSFDRTRSRAVRHERGIRLAAQCCDAGLFEVGEDTAALLAERVDDRHDALCKAVSALAARAGGLPAPHHEASQLAFSASGSDCTGKFSFQWTTGYMNSALLSPGDAVYCQYWYRDPADPFPTGLTDALEFVVCY
jgi:hypothetical protein